jgi:superfamily II RNA helicase
MLTKEDRAEIKQLIEEEVKSLRSGARSDYPLHASLLRISQSSGQAPEPAAGPSEDYSETLVNVTARAIEVLGTREKALRWLKTPVRSLSDQTPLSLLGCPNGIVQVVDALGQIEHGVW